MTRAVLLLALPSLALSMPAQGPPQGPRTVAKPVLVGTVGAGIPEQGALGPLADLDGDGGLDLLGEGEIRWNDGSGSFLDSVPVAIAAEARIVFFHADGDGHPDLLTRAHLYLGDGAGGLVDASTRLPAGTITDRGVAADLDGDGDQDLVSVQRSGFPTPALVRFSQNDGKGFFDDASGLLPPAPGSSDDVLAADVDGDGDLDLVLGASGAGRLWRNEGAIGFVHDPAAIADGTSGAVVLDADGDGDLDLAVVGSNQLLLNDGTGIYAALSLPPLEVRRDATGALVLDREADGDADLVLLYSTTPDPSMFDLQPAPDRLLVNQGGVFTDSPDLPALESESVAGFAEDLDGDGDTDLMIAARTYPHRLYWNDGQGRFAPVRDTRRSVSFSGLDGRGVAVGDLDGDGLPDALCTRGVLLNGPPGTLALADRILPAAPRECGFGSPVTVDIALGDVDGDGDVDALLGADNRSSDCGVCPECRYQWVWINDGAANFADETESRWPAEAFDSIGTTRQVELVELDGDGDLDAACVRAPDDFLGTGNSACYGNDGTGRFSLRETIGATGYAGAFADLDGDLDVDFFEGAYFDHPSRLFLNDGRSHFEELAGAVPPDPRPNETYRVLLADVDLDGDLDVYQYKYVTPSTLLLNDGQGFLTDASERLEDRSREAFAFADLDLDADPDLVGTETVWLNDGRGFFSSSSEALRSPHFLSGAPGVDLDLDGDPDFLLQDFSSDLPLLTGLVRHLESFGPLRLGKRFALGLHGPPRTPWLLFASLGSARIPLGARGWLLVDPRRLLQVRHGLLDARGEARHELPVPAGLAPIGRTVSWQAFVGRPAHSTNLVVEPVTGL